MTTTDRLGIKFPATILQGHDFVGGIDFYHYGGEYVVYVHQGGEDAPGTVVYTQPFEISSGSLRWNHFEFETPVRIDTTQNLWITIRVLEPIALIGVPHLNIRDGNWVSTDNGATWQHLDELPRFSSMSDSTLGWLLRCMTVHDSVVNHKSILHILDFLQLYINVLWCRTQKRHKNVHLFCFPRSFMIAKSEY